MKNPCQKDCPERASDCHISCGRYKAWREYLDEKNKRIRQEKDADVYEGMKGSRFRAYWLKDKVTRK